VTGLDLGSHGHPTTKPGRKNILGWSSWKAAVQNDWWYQSSGYLEGTGCPVSLFVVSLPIFTTSLIYQTKRHS